MNSIQNINNAASNAIQKTNGESIQSPPSPSAASAAQFLDQLLPKTAVIASPEQVLIEEIKKRHLNVMNTDLSLNTLSAGGLSPENLIDLQRTVLNANINIDVVSKLASLLSTSITKIVSVQ